MKIVISFFLACPCILSAQLVESDYKYLWTENTGSVSTFEDISLKASLGVSYLELNKIYSIAASIYISDFVLEESGDDKLAHVDVCYGYVLKKKYWFCYAKTGLSLAYYSYPTSSKTTGSFFTNTSYEFKTEFLPAIPIELGIQTHFKWFNFGLVSGYYFGASSYSNAYVGVKLASGNFR